MALKKLFHFFPTPRYLKFSYVGVEISSDCLKYAELTNDGKGTGLGRHGIIPFPFTEDIFENEPVKKALMEMKEKDKVNFVKATLPEEMTYLFTLDVEGDNEVEIKNYIEFHLEENVPLSGGDALFDFYMIPGAIKKAIVSVVSAQNVEKYISLFESVGIEPVAFMVESSSLSRSIIKRGSKEANLIVYLSEHKTVCSIVSDGFVQFSSTISSGGSLLTEVLKKQFNVSEEEARKMKETKGFTKQEGNEELFSMFMNSSSVLRDEIQRVAIFWQTHKDKDGKNPIQKIILCGRDAVMPGLADYLSSSLKIPVETANVWKNIPRYVDEVPPVNYRDSLDFGACLGLSLQGS